VYSQLALTRSIDLRSVNGRSQTAIRQRATEARVVYLSHTNARVTGFTLRGSRYSGSGTGGGAYVTAGTVTNCLITDNSCGSYQAWGTGSGLYMTGGHVVDCVVSNNGAAGWQYGPGVYMNGGLLDRCVICNNSGQQQYLTGGAGVLLDNGTLRNCLIRDNITQGANINGGGVCQRGGTMANCTIVSNTCSYTAGGLYMTAGTAYNLIVSGNANPTNLWQTGGTITYSCAPELTSGTGNITNNPQFMFKGVVPYQLAVGSPCIDAGTNQTWMTNAVDLAGDARILGRRVNMGAYEYVLPAGTGFIFR
jgi:hypothetical protein